MNRVTAAQAEHPALPRFEGEEDEDGAKWRELSWVDDPVVFGSGRDHCIEQGKIGLAEFDNVPTA
jgi:hypothetical protein